jgi:peroxin-5
MAAFLSGSAIDCGPSNVLKNVGGRIDRDVGLQQVCRRSGDEG